MLQFVHHSSVSSHDPKNRKKIPYTLHGNHLHATYRLFIRFPSAFPVFTVSLFKDLKEHFPYEFLPYNMFTYT